MGVKEWPDPASRACRTSAARALRAFDRMGSIGHLSWKPQRGRRVLRKALGACPGYAAPCTEPLDSGDGRWGSRIAFGSSTQEPIFWSMNASPLASGSWEPEAFQIASAVYLNRRRFERQHLRCLASCGVLVCFPKYLIARTQSAAVIDSRGQTLGLGR
jgi:hypothetical protein